MNDPDRELVQRCQEGHGPAFEEAYRELYDLFKDRVFTICLRVTGTEEDALDAAQETMVSLARRIRSFQFRSRFSSWVYRIAVNAAIDVRRRRLDAPHGTISTTVGGVGEAGAAEPVMDAETADPAARAMEAESRQAVKKALASISPRFSSILVLRYIEGLSYEEVAETLDCNLGTVKSRLNRAHAALRDHLSHLGVAGPESS
ncbi:MAG: RNA polymerase sigma factor [Planctomycetota bacterium]